VTVVVGGRATRLGLLRSLQPRGETSGGQVAQRTMTEMQHSIQMHVHISAGKSCTYCLIAQTADVRGAWHMHPLTKIQRQVQLS
jgi:hypothetical protein